MENILENYVFLAFKYLDFQNKHIFMYFLRVFYWERTSIVFEGSSMLKKTFVASFQKLDK